MGYWNDYQPDGIKANIVPKEGIYQVKIVDTIEGTMEGTGKRYTQVKTVVRSEGYPQLSLFLTEGPNFNGVVTAFYDTFGIERGNRDPNTWKDRKGMIRIRLQKKGDYMNMIPSYITGDDGYVMRQNPSQVQQIQNAFGGTVQQQPEHNSYDNGSDFPDDIPF